MNRVGWIKKAIPLSQAYSQTPRRRQLQLIGLFMTVLVTAALITSGFLIVSATSVSMGHEVLSMQRDIEKLERDNANAETQLGFLTSVETVQARAEEMGFQPVDTDHIIYLKVPGYTERQTAVLAPAPGPVTARPAGLPPEYRQSLLDWFRVNIINPSGIFSQVIQ